MIQPTGTQPGDKSLWIGDVELRAVSHITLLPHADSAYDSFYRPPGSRSYSHFASMIDIHILDDRCPPSDAPVIFETGHSWKMQREDDGYRAVFYRLDGKRIRFIVRSDVDTTKVNVHVNQDAEVASSYGGAAPDPLHYPLDQFLLMNHLTSRSGVLVHATGVVLDQKAVVFPGVSGAGKSTLANAFITEGLGDRLLSDDRVVLRSTICSQGAPSGADASCSTVVWGTPWPGEARVARDENAPLHAVMFLKKSDKNAISLLEPGAALRKLMPAVSCPWYDVERGNEVLETCARLVETTPCYELSFTPGPGVVDLLVGGSLGRDVPMGMSWQV